MQKQEINDLVHQLNDVYQEIANLIIAWNRRHCKDMKKATRGDYLVRTIATARAFVKEQMVDPDIAQALARNEDGDADLYIKLNRDKFIYDHAAGRWYVWCDHYWAEDIKNEALRAVDAVVDEYNNHLKRKMSHEK